MHARAIVSGSLREMDFGIISPKMRTRGTRKKIARPEYCLPNNVEKSSLDANAEVMTETFVPMRVVARRRSGLLRSLRMSEALFSPSSERIFIFILLQEMIAISLPEKKLSARSVVMIRARSREIFIPHFPYSSLY